VKDRTRKRLDHACTRCCEACSAPFVTERGGGASARRDVGGLQRTLSPNVWQLDVCDGAYYRPRSRDWRGPEAWDGVLVPYDTRPMRRGKGVTDVRTMAGELRALRLSTEALVWCEHSLAGWIRNEFGEMSEEDRARLTVNAHLMHEKAKKALDVSRALREQYPARFRGEMDALIEVLEAAIRATDEAIAETQTAGEA
jgi:hypothetical protein